MQLRLMNLVQLKIPQILVNIKNKYNAKLKCQFLKILGIIGIHIFQLRLQENLNNSEKIKEILLRNLLWKNKEKAVKSKELKV